MKLSELPIAKFNGEHIDNVFFVNYQHLYRVDFKDVFEWIKKEAVKNGLTIELKEDKIVFIKKDE